MSLEELIALPVSDIADKTCALFLWATNPKLPDALAVMKAWGFKYSTVFKVWTKRYSNGAKVCGLGFWSRPSTEMLLVGTKGSGITKYRAKKAEPQEHESVITTHHSQKPAEITAAVKDFLNVDRRIELFARPDGPTDGWDLWGLEVPGFFKGNPA